LKGQEAEARPMPWGRNLLTGERNREKEDDRQSKGIRNHKAHRGAAEGRLQGGTERRLCARLHRNSQIALLCSSPDIDRKVQDVVERRKKELREIQEKTGLKP